VKHANAFETKWKTTVGEHAKDAIELTSSTLTLRKLNGLSNAWRTAQSKKKKLSSAKSSSNNKSGDKDVAPSGVGRGRGSKKGVKRRRGSSLSTETNDEEQNQPDLTAEEYAWCQQTLHDLTEHPLSLPFLDPVDDTIVSYHSVINEPMDFATMAYNLNVRLRGGERGPIPKKKKSKKINKSSTKVNHTNGYYRTKTSFLRDLRLIFSNCRSFNAEGSELYADAVELERSLDSQLGIEQHRRRYAANRMSDDALKWCGNVLHQMRCHKDAFPFQMPVDKSLKDYHRKIKKPIDFMTLGRRLHEGMYPDRIAFCDQIKLIFENCRGYNPLSSDLCKMAGILEKYFHNIVPESILAEEAEMLRKKEEEAEKEKL